jgi:hypothetical protein
MKRSPLLVALLVAAPLAWAAPAPVYKERPSLESAHNALPKDLRDEIDHFHRHLPERIARTERNLRLASTQRSKELHLAGIAVRKASFYRFPIEMLEGERTRSLYQSREDQRKIGEALKFYRLRYHEAKQKGILVEPRGMVPLR